MESLQHPARHDPPSHCSPQSYCSKSQTSPKPVLVTKEEIRGWRRSRPLSADEHTGLAITMWKRTSLSKACIAAQQGGQATERACRNSCEVCSTPPTESSLEPLPDDPSSPSNRSQGTDRDVIVDSDSDYDSTDEPSVEYLSEQISANNGPGPQPDLKDNDCDDQDAATMPDTLPEGLDDKTGEDFWGPVLAFLRSES